MSMTRQKGIRRPRLNLERRFSSCPITGAARSAIRGRTLSSRLTNNMIDAQSGLVRHFEHIYTEHMRDLPIVNPRVQVEAVGFRGYEDHEIGVLITPWFMNLVLLPAGEAWADSAQGDSLSIEFPSGPIEFTTSRDDELGTYLTAVLFRSVSDFPDQSTARAVAEQVMKDLFVPSSNDRKLSRRELLTGLQGR